MGVDGRWDMMDGFSVLIGHYMYHVLYEERCNGLVYAIGGRA